MELFLPIILGTGRHGRQSEFAAKRVLARAQGRNFKTEIIDVRSFVTCITNPPEEKNPKAESWKEIAMKADGFLIVTPEYNHSYPGELKMFLDEALAEYKKKPVATVTVSSGAFGGVRAGEHLNALYVTLGLVPVSGVVPMPNVKKIFDEKGELLDLAYDKRFDGLIDQLVWFAEILKTGREKSNVT